MKRLSVAPLDVKFAYDNVSDEHILDVLEGEELTKGCIVNTEKWRYILLP